MVQPAHLKNWVECLRFRSESALHNDAAGEGEHGWEEWRVPVVQSLFQGVDDLAALGRVLFGLFDEGNEKVIYVRPDAGGPSRVELDGPESIALERWREVGFLEKILQDRLDHSCVVFGLNFFVHKFLDERGVLGPRLSVPSKESVNRVVGLCRAPIGELVPDLTFLVVQQGIRIGAPCGDARRPCGVRR